MKLKPSSLTDKKCRAKRVAKQIADRLFTVHYGMKRAESGNRLAVMKGDIDLGGWGRPFAEKVIEEILLNNL